MTETSAVSSDVSHFPLYATGNGDLFHPLTGGLARRLQEAVLKAEPSKTQSWAIL